MISRLTIPSPRSSTSQKVSLHQSTNTEQKEISLISAYFSGALQDHLWHSHQLATRNLHDPKDGPMLEIDPTKTSRSHHWLNHDAEAIADHGLRMCFPMRNFLGTIPPHYGWLDRESK